MGSSCWNDSEDERVPARRFNHADVISAYSTWCSPSTPDAYVRALAQRYPLNERTTGDERRAIAIADYGLHSALKAAVEVAEQLWTYFTYHRRRTVATRQVQAGAHIAAIAAQLGQSQRSDHAVRPLWPNDAHYWRSLGLARR